MLPQPPPKEADLTYKAIQLDNNSPRIPSEGRPEGSDPGATPAFCIGAIKHVSGCDQQPVILGLSRMSVKRFAQALRCRIIAVVLIQQTSMM